MSEFPIPMGFRFDPSDEELIKYLRLQGNGDPLPWNGIIYKDLYGPNAAPWVVFSGGAHWEKKTEGGATNSTTFVFTKLIRFANSGRISRTSGGGTWSAQRRKKIFSSETGKIVGFKRMLSFKNPDSGGGSLDFGHWIMHEYSLSNKAAAAADDLVVCRITRRDKNLGRSRPQPQLFSPAISDGGSSAECKHVPSPPTNKRAAEECYAQEECKAQKLSGDGFAAEAPAPHLFSPTTAHVKDVSCNEEKPGGSGGGSSSFPDDEEVVDDSWLVDALEQDENIEPPYGGSSTAVAENDSWRESLLQNFDNIVKSCHRGASHQSPQEAAEAEAAADPLQVSALSPYEYGFSFATECMFDDVLDLGPLWP